MMHKLNQLYLYKNLVKLKLFQQINWIHMINIIILERDNLKKLYLVYLVHLIQFLVNLFQMKMDNYFIQKISIKIKNILSDTIKHQNFLMYVNQLNNVKRKLYSQQKKILVQYQLYKLITIQQELMFLDLHYMIKLTFQLILMVIQILNNLKRILKHYIHQQILIHKLFLHKVLIMFTLQF